MPTPSIKTSKTLIKTLATLQQTDNVVNRRRFELLLFELYNHRLLAYASSFFLPSEVEDIIQQFYLNKIFGKKLSGYPTHSVMEFEKYLFVSLRNHCFSQLEKRSKRQQVEVSFAEMPTVDYSETDKASLIYRSQLRPLLKSLKTRQMLAIFMRMEGLSCQQIGKILGVKAHNVTNMVSRGKDKMIKYLMAEEGTEPVFKDEQNWSNLLSTIPDEQIRTFLSMVLFTDFSFMEILEKIGLANKPMNKVASITLVYIRRYYKSVA